MDIQAQIQFIGKLLINKGFLSNEQVSDFEKEIQGTSLPQTDFESLLIQKGLVTEEMLLKVYSEYLGIPFLKLNQVTIDPHTVSLIPAKFANRNKLIAIKKEAEDLTVLMRYPFDLEALDELKILTRLNIQPVLAATSDIEEATRQYYGLGAETVEKLVKDRQSAGAGNETLEPKSISDIEDIAKDASMVNFVNQLLSEAFQQRATDIHIEPFERQLRIRYRVDGLLTEAKTPPEVNKLHEAIISRFKIMANLNVAEKRRPQDGRCKIRVNDQDLDLRLSTFPTLFGEGLSIRLLSQTANLMNLDQLGFLGQDLERLKGVLSKPHGILLVTGPTGCGKTTTLYACINYLKNERVNIVTLEDPIEYQLDGINQIQTNPKIDLTFANGFRSILRQDPDIILVGEIRDAETAHIAIRAALTGHLILSTLHTNNALATIARLLNLGLEPYLLAGTLRGVMAQRLVRLICPHCKQPYRPATEVLENIGLARAEATGTFYRGQGCPECNGTGFKGRIAIFELMILDENLSSLIIAGAPKDKLEKEARALGMKTLLDDGLEKARQGLTTLEEVLRVAD
jgi:type IV pilus assembly protein PilB